MDKASFFSSSSELNVSHNRMSILPEEISKCTQLQNVDISHNSFIALPNCLLNLPKIVKLNAKKNFIAGNFQADQIFSFISGRPLHLLYLLITDVDVELISTCDTLENLNLEDNPLARDCQERLSSVTSLRVSVTARDMEEWEDLSI